MAKKMGNKLVAICTVALGAAYGAGYLVTKTPASASLLAVPSSLSNTTTASTTGTSGGSSSGKTLGSTFSSNSSSGSNSNSASTNSNATGSSSPSSGSQASGSTSSSSTSSPSTHTTSSSSSTAPATKTSAVKKSTPPAKAKPAVNTTSQYLDGTYQGSGSDAIGTVYVAVTVQGGKITNCQITQCDTHYPQSYIDPVLPQEVIARQSAQVDVVSGATGSSYDFAMAVQQALTQAQNPHYKG